MRWSSYAETQEVLGKYSRGTALVLRRCLEALSGDSKGTQEVLGGLPGAPEVLRRYSGGTQEVLRGGLAIL